MRNGYLGIAGERMESRYYQAHLKVNKIIFFSIHLIRKRLPPIKVSNSQFISAKKYIVTDSELPAIIL